MLKLELRSCLEKGSMSISLSIEYSCPRCLREMVAKPELVARELPCPSCCEELLVPLPGDRFAVIVGTIFPPRVDATNVGLCPMCGKTIKVKLDYFGKRVKCNSCRSGLTISHCGVPHDVLKSERLDSFMKQLQSSPLTPRHLQNVRQLAHLRDCRCVEYLCRLLFSIRRDQPRFLAAGEAWIRERLDSYTVSYLDAWCNEYRRHHEPGFLDLVLDKSYHFRESNEFLAELELLVSEALVTIGDPRCVGALKRKLRSVIEHRENIADDPSSPFNLRFENKADQQVFDQLAKFLGFGRQ